MPRYAAIDIGSNSARMMAADVSGNVTTILAQDRQVTRLGESVFRQGSVSEESLDFLAVVLQRFAATCRRSNVAGVRAVATSAVRDASNQTEFLRRAAEALETEIEIISGPEEARLIHLGVQARWPRPDERTLIIDVGGGSAELIVSEGPRLVDAVSKPCGAVRFNELFLKHDPPTRNEITWLRSYISEKIDEFCRKHIREQFDRVIATSASAAAVVCAMHGIARTRRTEADKLAISTKELRQFFDALSASSVAQRRKIAGIGPRRAEIIVPGAAVFLRVLELFSQTTLHYSAAGVQDGIIADLAARGVGRERSRLSSEQRSLMEEMALRYRVKRGHAAHVAFLATELFELTQATHKLPPSAGKLLEAAAYLHDIGHFVSGSAHHKHSAYLVANSDLPGFNDQEREIITALCRFHRRSLPQVKHPTFDALHPEAKRMVSSLTPLLRMADSLDRSHEQRVRQVSGGFREGALYLSLESDTAIDFEIWAATKTLDLFRDFFGKGAQIQRAQRQTAIA